MKHLKMQHLFENQQNAAAMTSKKLQIFEIQNTKFIL